MHYAISYQNQQHDFLVCSPRRKSIKHCLLRVEKGLVLIRLGKLEYAIEEGQSFWLPFDTLSAITCIPNSQVTRIDVSSRVSTSMPKQAGFVELNELITAILNRLQSIGDKRELHADLLAVIRSDLATLKPKLYESPLSHKVSMWAPNKKSALDTELQLVLKVREARKQMQSGKKRDLVLSTLFENNSELYNNLEKIILGH